MRFQDFTKSVLLFASVSGFAFYFAAADIARVKSSNQQKSMAAVLINNDISELHCGNIVAAERACRDFPFQEIVSLGREGAAPALADVCQALETLQQKGIQVGLLYLTGHGSVFRGKQVPQGESCLMLKDRPLRVNHLAGRLGHGPCVIYSDVCYSPGLLDLFARRLQGDFLLLTDKPAKSPLMSCRGVSVRFWEHLIGQASRKTLWDAMKVSWRQVCSCGEWNQIGSNAVVSTNEQTAAYHHEEMTIKTGTGEK